MKRLAIVCIFVVVLGVGGRAAAQDAALAITGVTVIDVVTGAKIRDVTILVDAGRITAISRDAAAPGTQLVDGSGKYVIPGLWDVHTHIQSQAELDLFFPLLVAHGVLGIRDMGGLLPSEFRQGSERHAYVPRVVAAGPMVNGATPEGEEEAAIVDALVAKGVDFVKIASRIPRERFLAIAERAGQLGVHIAGHVPVTLSPAEASAVGLRTMEHFLEIHLAVSEDESSLREARIAAVEKEYSIRSVGFPPLTPLLARWSDEKASALFATLAANRTWQVPTLADFRAWAASGEPSFWENERLSLVPKSWRDSWRPAQHFEFRNIRPSELAEFYAHLNNWFEAQLDMTRRMHEAGVGFLAGTDASAWNFQVPGASLHEELAIFVGVGLTPLEALQTATVNVADYLAIDGYDGTVSVGQEADFVLLDGDPLDDVENTERIFGVVSDGAFIERRRLDELLKSVRH